ncbi:MAG: hypothetical protein F4014_15160 [Gemmatimonadetes bacterium]|nr:hypothetical protein [Gemmatimonadota bacterium]
MLEQGIDDHHIFPASYLKDEQGITLARNRDCILNRTLIDRRTNQIIGKRPPSDYMAEIQATEDFPFDSVLRSHLLPVGDSSPIWTDDYESFLNFRQQKLWREIKRVTGLKQASDLESEDGETV